jgi:protein-S-isoprenylcysteine O-methyltransferase Ste14
MKKRAPPVSGEKPVSATLIASRVVPQITHMIVYAAITRTFTLLCYHGRVTLLNVKAIVYLCFTTALMGVALFVPAWTLDYWQAWLYLVVFGVLSLAITVYLMVRDPHLLEHRVHGGPIAETSQDQRLAMSLASAGFIAILVVSALDHRFGWSYVPTVDVFGGEALIVAGYVIIFFVFRANTFASSTIEIATDQHVISTGPYAVVRHPMYAGAALYLIGMPLALGSWWGLLALAMLVPAFVWRMFDEEKTLAKTLPGYTDYRNAVKYRLIPHIW